MSDAWIRQKITDIPAAPDDMARHLRQLADDIERADGDIILIGLAVMPAEEPGNWQVQTIVEVEHDE